MLLLWRRSRVTKSPLWEPFCLVWSKLAHLTEAATSKHSGFRFLRDLSLFFTPLLYLRSLLSRWNLGFAGTSFISSLEKCTTFSRRIAWKLPMDPSLMLIPHPVTISQMLWCAHHWQYSLSCHLWVYRILRNSHRSLVQSNITGNLGISVCLIILLLITNYFQLLPILWNENRKERHMNHLTEATQHTVTSRAVAWKNLLTSERERDWLYTEELSDLTDVPRATYKRGGGLPSDTHLRQLSFQDQEGRVSD